MESPGPSIPIPERPITYGERWTVPVLLGGAVISVFLISLMIGSAKVPITDILLFLVGADVASVSEVVLYELRLPRALTALLCGAALGAAGLQLQTLFRNPLAGPWALGITDGAQLGVALAVSSAAVVGLPGLARLQFLSELGIVGGSFLGCAAVVVLIAAVAKRVSTVTLLVVGLMLGYLAQSLVSLVLHFTTRTQGRVFAGWSDASFARAHWDQFPVLLPLLIVGIVAALALVKPLNALLLGERYAATIGLPVQRARRLILAGAVTLIAPVTAYCGPVLFVGMIAPHLARGVLGTSDHRILMPTVLLVGALLGLGADLVVHLPWERHFLHLNAVNALVGAPVVLWVLLRSHHMRALAI